MQPLATTTSSAAPAPTGDAPVTCEDVAGSYADACPQCSHLCEGESDPAMCFNSVFGAVNGIQSDCWQHGGQNCRGQALDRVCGQPGAARRNLDDVKDLLHLEKIGNDWHYVPNGN